MRSSRKLTPHKRAAFTLIELLVTISIIALLIGLLLPAINSARKSARLAEVSTEIRSLENALSTFKAKYGTYPPSRITLHKDQAGWDGDNRSRVLIRRFWPSFDFTTDGAGGSFPFPSGQDYVRLDGPECLVFFLGGVRNTDGAYIGFSNNPTQPFTLSGSSRLAPNFSFLQDRMTDVDGDGLPEYADPLPGQLMPYIYLSGYDGKGYSTDDLDKDGDLTTTTTDKWMANIYTQTATSTSYWNREAYHIISPGFDGVSIGFDTTYPYGPYGPGGQFDSDTAANTLIGPREVERDNITNFGSGALAP